MATLLPEGKQSFTNSAGAPLVGGKVYTYDAGTSTPRPTYQDAAATVPNTNPVVLDARGEAVIFWSGAYKVVLKDAADVTVWTIDGVQETYSASLAYTDALRSDLASSAGGKGDSLLKHGVDATGESGPTLFNILRGRIRLSDFTGYDPSGATAQDTAMANAIAKAVARSGSNGDEIDVGYGDFLFNASITRPANVYLVGRGPGATRLKTTANTQLIKSVGSLATPVNRGGVIGMTLLGPGKANLSSAAIFHQWTNRALLEDLRMHGWCVGVYTQNVWQDSWRSLDVDGGGTDQSEVGFYFASKDPTAGVSNAVRAESCVAQGVNSYGWRIVNGDGSKLVNCEGMNGVHGLYAGDPAAALFIGDAGGTQALQFLHFANFLADTTSSHGIRFEKGAASAVQHIEMASVWTGSSSGGSGLYVAGASQMTFGTVLAIASGKSAVHMQSSTRCTFGQVSGFGYDTLGAANPGLLLADSQYNVVGVSNFYSTSGTAKGAVETGTSDNNLVMSSFLQNGYTRVGANSRFMRNNGAGGERRGSATVGPASTSVVVTHNCEGNPSIDDVKLTPRGTWGSSTKWWVSNMTATQFTINVDVAPGAGGFIFNWSIDQIGQ